MKNQSLSLVIFLLIFSYNVTAQNKKNDYRAISKEIIISIDEDSIAAFGMLAAGKEKKETIILLHGLPGNEKNLDLAQELRRNGRNVIYFNYRGSWGSQGEFMYSNCLEDATKVIDFFSTPENSEKYKIKLNSFILFGHSLGGGIALLKGARDKRVKKIVVCSPNPIGTLSQELMDWVYNYIKTAFMLNINPDKFYNELIVNKNSYNPLIYKNELSQKDVLIFDEDLRNKEWVDQLDNVEYLIWETDHSFSDKRLELIEKVNDWINN